jgi:PAS domain S-box-containing protein
MSGMIANMDISLQGEIPAESLTAALVSDDAARAETLAQRLLDAIPEITLEQFSQLDLPAVEAFSRLGLGLLWAESPEVLEGPLLNGPHAQTLAPLVVVHPAEWTLEQRGAACALGAWQCIREDCSAAELRNACVGALHFSHLRRKLRETGTSLARVAGARSRELFEAHEISDALFELSSDLAFIVLPSAPDYPIVELNPAAASMLREVDSIVPGAPLSRYLTDDSMSRLTASLGRITERMRDAFDIAFRARDGRRLNVNVVARALRYKDRPQVLLMCTPVQTETEVSRGGDPGSDTRRLRMMAAGTGMAMYDVNVRENQCVFSGAIRELTGLSGEEFDAYQGGRWLVLIHPDDRERVVQQYNKALDEVGKYELQYRVRHRGGDYRHVEDTGVCLPGKDGRAIRILGTLKDVTHRVQQEEAYKRAEAARMHSQKLESLGVLAGGIAHDFNNILTAIIGLTSLALRETDGNERLTEDLTEVLNAGNRARELVRQILTFSRQEDMERTTVDLNQIVGEVVRLVQAGLADTIRIETILERQPALILAHPAQLHQVVLNFCTNALHAVRGKEGHIRVIVESLDLGAEAPILHPRLTPGKYVRLRVEDNGHGMAPQLLERIFDPFFTTKGPGEGTGMGLAVVHGIVTSHGGIINVRSEPGDGTAFHTYFHAYEPASGTEPDSATALPGGAEPVAVIQTDEVIGAFVCASLRHQGYAVHDIRGLEAARDFVAREPQPGVELAVVDAGFRAPGIERLVRRFAERFTGVPMILLADSAHEEAPTGEGLPPIILLEQPLTFEQLARATRTALDSRKG